MLFFFFFLVAWGNAVWWESFESYKSIKFIELTFFLFLSLSMLSLTIHIYNIMKGADNCVGKAFDKFDFIHLFNDMKLKWCFRNLIRVSLYLSHHKRLNSTDFQPKEFPIFHEQFLFLFFLNHHHFLLLDLILTSADGMAKKKESDWRKWRIRTKVFLLFLLISKSFKEQNCFL